MATIPKMKMKNCIQCGRVFITQEREELCNECKARFHELEDIVKEYVKDHRGVSMTEVSEATGISKKLIQRMAREGVFADMPMGENFTYPCASCGTPIKSGTYCTSCLTRLRKETKKVAESMQIRFKEDMPTVKRLDAMAQREFDQEQRDKRTFRVGMKNIVRSK